MLRGDTAETEIIVAIAWRIVVTIRRTQVDRRIVPTATTIYAVRTRKP